ncbi:MAG: sensor histidine kinase [Aristaeellaceae bacterium]
MRLKQRLVHLMGNIKVRTKFVLILALAMALVFGSVLATFRLPYAAYDEQLYKSSVQMITLFADRIQAELEDAEELSYRILADNVVQKNLSVMKRGAPNTTAWVEAKNEVEDRVANFAMWFASGVCLQLRTPGGAQFSHFFRTSYTSNLLTDERMAQALEHHGSPVWLTEGENPARIFLLREIREIQHLTLDTLAVILVEMNLPGVVEASRSVMSGMGTPLSCAIYAEDVCLYASDDQVRAMHPAEDGYEHLTQDGNNLLCVRYTARNGWRYVTLVDYSGISATISGAASLALGADVVAMAAALALGVWLVASLLKHLRRLLEKFDAFAISGHVEDPDTSPYRDRGDEIGQLHRHFDKMTHDYHQMMRRGYEQQQLLQEKQMQQLRAQVRPHFLYNTLESIYCLAKQEGNERIAVMTDALGKMFRASLNDKRDIVTVEEDLQITREYLRIQEIRYGDRLRVEMAVDESILRNRIPAMTLQPLVENAVHHALEEMLDTCVIRVSGSREEAGVTLSVEDNGPGMDEDILNKMESGEIAPEGLGIGMRNINRRVQYAFGERYGLRVHSRPGWTCVSVLVPDDSRR